MIFTNLPACQRCGTHRLRTRERRMREQKRLGRDLYRLLHRVLGGVRDITDEAKSVTSADHLCPEGCQPLVRNGARLEITDIVGCVMHELDVPHAAFMCLL